MPTTTARKSTTTRARREESTMARKTVNPRSSLPASPVLATPEDARAYVAVVLTVDPFDFPTSTHRDIDKAWTLGAKDARADFHKGGAVVETAAVAAARMLHGMVADGTVGAVALDHLALWCHGYALSYRQTVVDMLDGNGGAR
jgi:hypothetical protein